MPEKVLITCVKSEQLIFKQVHLWCTHHINFQSEHFALTLFFKKRGLGVGKYFVHFNNIIPTNTCSLSFILDTYHQFKQNTISL